MYAEVTLRVERSISYSVPPQPAFRRELTSTKALPLLVVAILSGFGLPNVPSGTTCTATAEVGWAGSITATEPSVKFATSNLAPPGVRAMPRNDFCPTMEGGRKGAVN